MWPWKYFSEHTLNKISQTSIKTLLRLLNKIFPSCKIQKFYIWTKESCTEKLF